MIKAILKNTAIYAAMIVIVAVGSKDLYSFILLQRDPMFYEKTWTDTPTVRLNGVFKAHYSIARLRVCRTEVQNFMENDVTREIVLRQVYIGGAREVGSYPDVLNAFRLPPPNETGCFTFRTLAINECAEGVHTLAAPPIKFCVVD